MGLFDRFRKNKEKSEDKRDFSNDFKQLFEQYNNSRPQDKKHYLSELNKLTTSWSFEYPDDANFRIANLIIAKLSDEEIDYESKINLFKQMYTPQDKLMHSWFLNTVEDLIKVDSIDNDNSTSRLVIDSTDSVVSDSDFSNTNNYNSFDSHDKNGFISHEKGTYSYLNELIHNGEKEINLDCDIKFEGKSIFKFGIKVDVDGLIINGNGHTIDADNKARIFYVLGKNITIKNIILKNGFTNIAGGAISNIKDTSYKLINVTFVNNHANNGGAIYNFNSEICIENSKFLNNEANRGGTIFNEENGILKIHDCELKNNKAETAGTIHNMGGEIIIENTNFSNNNSITDSGAIYNHDKITIFKGKFDNNVSATGGAISNFGELNINQSEFIHNKSTENGGAIYNHINSILDIASSTFRENNAKLNGGVFECNGKLSIKNCIIENNSSMGVGGVLNNKLGSTLYISNTQFINNGSTSKDIIFNKSKDFKLVNCIFSKHDVDDVIINEKYLECIDSKFMNNSSNNIILNESSSILIISGGNFNKNKLSKSTINNIGENCHINNCIFEDNVSDEEYCNNIYNESKLELITIKIKNKGISILNKGFIKYDCETDEIQSKIRDLGKSEPIISTSSSHDYTPESSFCHLDNLIHNGEKIISLDKDIFLNDFEENIYGGGIELNIDGTTIDGKGKTIDAKMLSRIFIISGRDITLKNVIFKNGNMFNRYEEHTSGGGAILILNGSSLTLEKCVFLDNSSSDDGGAILNRGILNLIDCEFKNNHSNYNGGAVHNKNILNIQKTEFISNKSKLGSAIYNSGDLTINSKLDFIDNESNIDQPIFNANLISTSLDIEELIYNTAYINKKSNVKEPFMFLENKIKNLKEIILNEDITFDYAIDNELINKIDINENIVIDGNGHSIDGNNYEVLFKINKLIKVIFKNITFKNFYLYNQPLIENHGSIQFINCKFLNNTSINNLIFNKHQISIRDSSFSNNFSKRKSLIYTGYEFEIDNTNFINNTSYMEGSILSNELLVKIKNSNFNSNASKSRGGVINNVNRRSILDISDSSLSHNTAGNDGGAIINFGEINLYCSNFNKNKSEGSGGAIYNNNLLTLTDTEFLKNVAEDYGGALVNRNQAVINASNSKFILNKANEAGAIKYDMPHKVSLENCKLEENLPEDF